MELDDTGGRPWSGGVFAIENRASGRRHYVATTCIGKRVWDALDWLGHGKHKNYQLQEDWSANPKHFRILLVQKLDVKGLLNFAKQAWIDRDRESGRPPYNRKASMPRDRKKGLKDNVLLPKHFFDQPQPSRHVDAGERIRQLLKGDIFKVVSD